MPQIPVLIYTDAPDHWTGLARICRELALHIHANLSDTYRIATLGVFGRGSARFPWPQYYANGPEDAVYNLRAVTEDFFSGQRGVLFTITPPSWLFSIALPKYMEKEGIRWTEFVEWMDTRPFDIWSYLAIESHGPMGQYGPTTRAILSQLHRRVYYSRWGADIAVASAVEPNGQATFIHHGIDCNVWKPSPPEMVRKFRTELGVSPNDLLLGCVATNTRRKLLPLLFESAYILRHQLGSARLKIWINTSSNLGEYNLMELAACFNFTIDKDVLITSSNAKRPDQWLANMYSACDLTCLPTAGEGFGYPVIESLACGTPVITCAFGAQSELLAGWRDSWLCQPIATHIISNNTLIEPIYDPHQFASCLLRAWTELKQRGTLLREDCRQHALTWDWPAIWPHWSTWFQSALEVETVSEPTQSEESNATQAPVRRLGIRGAAISQFVPAKAPESNSLPGPVGGHPEPAGLQPPERPAEPVDRPAPIGVAGEPEPPGV